MNPSMLLLVFLAVATVIRYLVWLCAEIRLAPVAVETARGLCVAADDERSGWSD